MNTDAHLHISIQFPVKTTIPLKDTWLVVALGCIYTGIHCHDNSKSELSLELVAKQCKYAKYIMTIN